ncbi:MAG: hypothetical protein ACK44W_12725 [Planctomycetota bacterium]
MNSHRLWNAARGTFWAAGIALWALLWAGSPLGTTLLWNVLIPLAPAVFVFAPGVWRNICPLATTARLGERWGRGAARPLSPVAQGRLLLLAAVALGIIVPLRHLGLNWRPQSSALVLTVAAGVALGMGLVFRRKSGWCNSLCPVHPVERLYGFRPAVRVANVQCGSCRRCSSPCPEVTPGLHPFRRSPEGAEGRVGTLMAGGFVGFIVGWFQVPDFQDGVGLASAARAYLFPWGGAAVSLMLYAGLRRVLPSSWRPALLRLFAASAVAAYYWYRIPALVGIGLHPPDGMLVDLRNTGAGPLVAAVRWVLPTFLLTWAALPRRGMRSWTVRPPMARPEPVPGAVEAPGSEISAPEALQGMAPRP